MNIEKLKTICRSMITTSHYGTLDNDTFDDYIQQIESTISQETAMSNVMADHYKKAIDSLARYKFYMFGYHAAQWVNLNKLLPTPRPNPFKYFVDAAKTKPWL